MKKLLSSITLIALAAILFSSCSNSSKLAFNKRHYRSGLFVDHVGKVTTKENPSVAKLTIRSNKVSSAPAIVKLKIQTAISTPAVTSQISAVVKKNTIQLKTERNAPVAINSIAVTQNAPVLNTRANNYSNNEEESEGHMRVDANVAFVVVVLCAIFIPPLGVALAYGIDSYFWIDLILTLLFFFPGMIFALIVVLM